MLSKRNIAVIILNLLIMSGAVYAADGITDSYVTSSPGLVQTNEPAGEIPVDDGMEPNPLPLAPAIPQPPTSKTSKPIQDQTQPTTPVKAPVETTTPAVKKTSTSSRVEKCKIVDRDGNGLIKAYTADSGRNLEGDANAWIWVPYGQCKKLNRGDYSGVSPEIRAKINKSNIKNAQTIE